MSQATIPFQPAPVLDDAPLPEGDEPTSSNRRALFALAALAGLALLGLAAYFLVFAGGGEDAPAATTPPSNNTAPKAPAPATAVDAPVVQKKLSAKRYGTDPFKPLISEPVAAPAAAAGTTSGTTASGATPTGGTATTGGGTTTTNPSTSATGTTVPVTGTSYRFQVVKVAAGNASVDVKINGKSYTKLKAGEVFAKLFKVRFIGGAVNSFQIGDEVFSVAGKKVVNVSG